jgi:phage terminase large subunit-like protein
VTEEKIEAQPGKQTMFLECAADVVWYGGSAFCAKSFSLLMGSTRFAYDSKYTGIIFRRISTSITAGGGLWDTANIIYRTNNNRARLVKSRLTAFFPGGAKIKFSHLENEGDVYSHHGGQYAFIGFDELGEFTRRQFMYLLTRNRGMEGYKGPCRVRATMNPDAGHWTRDVVDWWIGEDGYPIPDRCGVIKYFTVLKDEWLWVDKDWTQTLSDGTVVKPKTFTFIGATISDNPLGRRAQPQYESTLYAQDDVTKERLLKGNWNIAYKGNILNPLWYRVIKREQSPKNMRMIRYYDMAATESKEGSSEPASTAGGLLGLAGGNMYIVDIYDAMETPGKIEEQMKTNAINDGVDTIISWEEEKGSAGRYVSNHLKNDVFKGYTAIEDPVSGDKPSRAKPWAALAQNGHVYIVEGAWNKKFKEQSSVFYTPGHKCDMIDCISGGYKVLHSMDLAVRLVHVEKVLISDTKLPPPYEVLNAFSLDESMASVVTCQWDSETGRLHVNYEASMDTVESMVEYILSVRGARNIGPTEFDSDAQRTVVTTAQAKGVRIEPDEDFDALASLYFLNSVVDKRMFSVSTLCRRLLLSIQNDTEIKAAGPFLTSLLYVVNNIRLKRKAKDRDELKSFSKEKMKFQEEQYKLLTGEKGEEQLAEGWYK